MSNCEQSYVALVNPAGACTPRPLFRPCLDLNVPPMELFEIFSKLKMTDIAVTNQSLSVDILIWQLSSGETEPLAQLI